MDMHMTQIKYDNELDCRGMNCPLPVVKTRKAIDALSSGQVLKLIATDPGSQKDIPAFCRRNKHELLEASEEAGEFIYYLKKS